jgi:hypothetical protein
LKKLFFIVAIFVTTFLQKSFAQDSTAQSQLSKLLTSYYNIKDALVAGNSKSASTSAELFVKAANGIDYKLITEANINALLKDADNISGTNDIKQQREIFSNFSTNMFALAKSVMLSTQPIYEAYCPMKKAYWLSIDKAIKNPYYGTAMLTCGSVKETF